MKLAKIFATSAVLVAASVASAGSHSNMKSDINDPITLRMNLMQHVGATMKLLGGMANGAVPFDGATAEAGLRALSASAIGFPAQFPDGSDTGHDTEAASAIWLDRAGFTAAAAKFIADTEAAVNSKPTDADTLKSAFGQVASNCRACHETYRAKK